MCAELCDVSTVNLPTTSCATFGSHVGINDVTSTPAPNLPSPLSRTLTPCRSSVTSSSMLQRDALSAMVSGWLLSAQVVAVPAHSLTSEQGRRKRLRSNSDSTLPLPHVPLAHSLAASNSATSLHRPSKRPQGAVKLSCIENRRLKTPDIISTVYSHTDQQTENKNDCVQQTLHTLVGSLGFAEASNHTESDCLTQFGSAKKLKVKQYLQMKYQQSVEDLSPQEKQSVTGDIVESGCDTEDEMVAEDLRIFHAMSDSIDVPEHNSSQQHDELLFLHTGTSQIASNRPNLDNNMTIWSDGKRTKELLRHKLQLRQQHHHHSHYHQPQQQHNSEWITRCFVSEDDVAEMRFFDFKRSRSTRSSESMSSRPSLNESFPEETSRALLVTPTSGNCIPSFQPRANLLSKLAGDNRYTPRWPLPLPAQEQTVASLGGEVTQQQRSTVTSRWSSSYRFSWYRHERRGRGGSVFRDRAQRDQDEQQAHGDDAKHQKTHICEVCTRIFSRSDMLARHMRLHTGSRPYACAMCALVFSRSDHLHTHMRIHTGEKPYKCPHCPYAAPRRDQISRHIRTHTADSSDNNLLTDHRSTMVMAVKENVDDDHGYSNT